MPAFFVAGRPVPQGSKTYLPGGHARESSPGLKPWRDAIAWQARAAGLTGSVPPAARAPAFSVRLRFLFPRPASGPNATTRLPTSGRGIGDLDKLTRAVLDALTGIAYGDDRQVTHLSASKEWTNGAAGVHVTVDAVT